MGIVFQCQIVLCQSSIKTKKQFFWNDSSLEKGEYWSRTQQKKKYIGTLGILLQNLLLILSIGNIYLTCVTQNWSILDSWRRLTKFLFGLCTLLSQYPMSSATLGNAKKIKDAFLLLQTPTWKFCRQYGSVLSFNIWN